MNVSRRYTGLAALTAMAGLLALVPLANPAFAWTASLSTCVAGSWSSTCTTSPSFAIGTLVPDTAKVTLSADGGPYGSVNFYVASGTCADHGTGALVGSSSVTGSGSTYYTQSWDSTGKTAGNYVWLVYYTGTGSGGYPRAPTSGYDCEPFSLFVGPPPPHVPQFPLGSLLIFALAIPALLLLEQDWSRPQRRFPKSG